MTTLVSTSTALKFGTGGSAARRAKVGVRRATASFFCIDAFREFNASKGSHEREFKHYFLAVENLGLGATSRAPTLWPQPMNAFRRLRSSMIPFAVLPGIVWWQASVIGAD